MKLSAGILLYRQSGQGLEVLLAHSGGPFYARKDNGAWTIPKGEVIDGEDVLEAAKREFGEETGFALTADVYVDLGEVKTSSKLVHVWACPGDADPLLLQSNTFDLEWPPRSGQIEKFPECDRAAWFSLRQARQKLFKNQVPFIDTLQTQLGLDEPQAVDEPEQTALF